MNANLDSIRINLLDLTFQTIHGYGVKKCERFGAEVVQFIGFTNGHLLLWQKCPKRDTVTWSGDCFEFLASDRTIQRTISNHFVMNIGEEPAALFANLI